ncbi:MAG: twin-arginine translocation signal domain-containing protein, partial [Verrucomicrobiota bacterium]|nr:twin-arginine translocation signal domain-containing protein [Verrucomicrobiota bacterium]
MKTDPNSTRRTFLKTTSATAATVGAALAFPTVTFGKPDSRKLKIGWIGCGGRGSGAINQALRADSNVELWSIGEAFADKAAAGLKAISKIHPGKVNVDKSRIHVGLDAYQKVIE